MCVPLCVCVLYLLFHSLFVLLLALFAQKASTNWYNCSYHLQSVQRDKADLFICLTYTRRAHNLSDIITFVRNLSENQSKFVGKTLKDLLIDCLDESLTISWLFHLFKKGLGGFIYFSTLWQADYLSNKEVWLGSYLNKYKLWEICEKELEIVFNWL